MSTPLDVDEIKFVRNMIRCGLTCDRVKMLGTIDTWARYRVLIGSFTFFLFGFWIFISGMNAREDPEKRQDATLIMLLGVLMIAAGVWVYMNRNEPFVKTIFFAGD